ncbi:MAG TPA: hypothetical protein VKV74_06525 [Bryobacteraceae bacterium]|nr:hypothetical protein [Bryobacteraceae bacterium]
MTSSALSPYALIVNEPNEAAWAVGGVFEPSAVPVGRPGAQEAPGRLNIFVLFTSAPATLAALKQAGCLAAELGGRIILVALHTAPYPLPLTAPPVAMDWNERRLRVIAGQSRVETIVHICLCRDERQTLENLLPPCSLVLVGGRKRWWPTRERRWARVLRRQGHEVILIETE